MEGVVIGAAVGYRFEQVATFVRSLRGVGYTGKIVLLIDRQTYDRERGTFLHHGVTIVPVTNNFSVVGSRRLHARGLRLALRSTPIRQVVSRMPLHRNLALQWATNTRFAWYRALVADQSDLLRRTAWVFLTDVRDVVFQRDPSSDFSGVVAKSGIGLFAEGPSTPLNSAAYSSPVQMTIGDSPSTVRWVSGLVDTATTKRLMGAQLLCSGTILLRAETLEELCNRMIGVLRRLQPGRPSKGYDQGALNILYHTGELRDLDPVVYDNGCGGVGTLGAICTSSGWHRDGTRVFVGSHAPAVIHQFDRIPELAIDIQRQWSG